MTQPPRAGADGRPEPVADRAGEGLRRALGLASDGVPVPDGLAETTWLRGRRVRRHRAVVGGAGAAAVVGTTVLAWAVLGPGALPGARDAIPAGGPVTTSAPAPPDGAATTGEGPEQVTGPVLVETAPEPTQEEADAVPVDASARTERVWGVLRSACLEDRGYEVVVTGSTLTATQRGAQAGDYTRDTSLCDAEIGMRLPPVEIAFEGGELASEADAALRAVHARYVEVAACVRAAGLPVDEAPAEEEFVDLFAREWMPSWHPWTAAAAEGHYAQVRSLCPVSSP